MANQVNVRLDPELISRTRARAKSEGVTFTDMVIQGLVAVLESYGEDISTADIPGLTEPTKTQPAPLRATAIPTIDALRESSPPTCEHPKDQWQKLSWGTVCGICKRKMR